MNKEVVGLIDKKLAIVLRDVDSRITSEIREQWKVFSPAPNCPTPGAVQEEIKNICHRGYKERAEVAKTEIERILVNHGNGLNQRSNKKIIEVVEKHFPFDIYVSLAKQTEAVYQRASAPKSRMNGNTISIKSSLIEVGAANLSRQAINNIRKIIKDYELRARRERPSRISRGFKVIGNILWFQVLRGSSK